MEDDAKASPDAVPDGMYAAHVCGYRVLWPYRPWGVQLAFASRVLRCLTDACHGLLESPTGTGKSLSILCSTLAWQQAYDAANDVAYLKRRQGEAQRAQRAAAAEAAAVLAAEAVVDVDVLSSDPCSDAARALEESPLQGLALPKELELGANDLDDFKPRKARQRATTKRRKHVVIGSSSSDGGGDGDDDTAPSSRMGSLLKWAKRRHGDDDDDDDEDDDGDEGEGSQRRKVPRIFIATRTHSQVGQLLQQLRLLRTAYLPTIGILGSRRHYCIHPSVSSASNLQTACKRQLRSPKGCMFHQRRRQLSMHPDVNAGGLRQLWDVEDLVRLGRQHRACPYFASRSLARRAEVVFCPYNYVLDPAVRAAMGISLSGSVVVFDEAHNIEGTARGAASCNVSVDVLGEAVAEVGAYVDAWLTCKRRRRTRDEGEADDNSDGAVYAPSASLREALVAMCDALKALDALVRESLQGGGLVQAQWEEDAGVWAGSAMLAVLAECGWSSAAWPSHCKAWNAVRDESKASGDAVADRSLATLTELWKVLGFCMDPRPLLAGGLPAAHAYRMVVRRRVRHGSGGSSSGRKSRQRRKTSGGASQWDAELCFWCLHPGVAFASVRSEARSVILTSGTLSPMGAFATELSTDFAYTLESSHIINMQRQLFIRTVARGPSGEALDCTYRNSENVAFRDEVGAALRDVCATVPGGVLCFFPSYSFMERMMSRWVSTGAWAELQSQKLVVAEPRQRGDALDDLLEQFYGAVRCARGATGGRGRTGALLLAVCRGKVSEGIDFRDDNARAVVVVGIPYPHVRDIQVRLKRAHNDELHTASGGRGASGSQWYDLQAFRALNQAMGRCIRHRSDWGAILLLDKRMGRADTMSKLPKWLRSQVQTAASVANKRMRARGAPTAGGRSGLGGVECSQEGCSGASTAVSPWDVMLHQLAHFVQDAQMVMTHAWLCIGCGSALAVAGPNPEAAAVAATTGAVSTGKSFVRDLSAARFGPSGASDAVIIVSEASLSTNTTCSVATHPDGRAIDCWCEPDGIVYRALACRTCKQPQKIGVQIVATSAANVDHMNQLWLLPGAAKVGRIPMQPV